MPDKEEWDRPENLPLPVPDEDSLMFWQGLSDGKLLLQTCIDCGTKSYPPVSMCCQQFNFESKNRVSVRALTGPARPGPCLGYSVDMVAK